MDINFKQAKNFFDNFSDQELKDKIEILQTQLAMIQNELIRRKYNNKDDQSKEKNMQK